MGPSLAELQAGSPLSGSNASYVESLYERYLADPAGIDPAWRAYFDALPASAPAMSNHIHRSSRP
jgi:2-oxoglutarate dehydrogenase complex dehydrogenase (E1) component-like enzyme